MEVVLRVISGPHKGLRRVFREGETVTVGRSSLVGLSLPEDRLLSREHFQVAVRPPLCALTDLGSTNGTKVNGLRVETSRLRDGDALSAGESVIEYNLVEAGLVGPAPTRCAGCGQVLPPEAAEADAFGPPLCDDCRQRRKRFPRTHRDYLIEKALGTGGMGEVYLARQISTHRPVAIKMMAPTGFATDKAESYFRREMMVLKDLLMPNGQTHPNIVTFYEIFDIDGQFQLVMEYVPGKNALEWVTGLGAPAPVATTARIGRLLLSALEFAHGKGYVHRDVKPSNLLVMGPTLRPKVKLTDFGLAKSFRETAGFVGLTHQGDVGGSVGFISPDHIREFGVIKEPADIYSAGATLYYLLTRKYPYLNFDPYRDDAYVTILEHPPVPLRAHRRDAPEGLERVLAKALAKHPDERWKSAREMSAALRPFSDDS